MMNLLKKVVKKLTGKGTPKFEDPPEISKRLEEVCAKVRAEKLTFLSRTFLHSLVHLVEKIEADGIEGSIIEAGCALGGSSVAMCNAKSAGREMHIYDTFEMIPPPTEEDGKDVHDRYEIIKRGDAVGFDGEEYYGYLKDIPERVTASFEKFDRKISENNVTLHKGLLQDTMSVDGPVALAHIDVDWYDPVYVCLERIVPNLADGGAIVLDDYFAWSGCRDATDAFFKDKKKDFAFCTKYGHMIVRKAS